jgi:hypothetical protein
VLTALFVYALVELTSCVGLSALGNLRNRHFTPILKSELSAEHREILGGLLRDETQYLVHSPTLGWTIKPNGESGLYRANSQGFRAERDYPQHPTEDLVRVATFGDSFTHGDDVPYDETWQAQLGRATANLEVLNFGVGGYGLDQAYLRYEQDGAAFHSDLVFIGFLVGDIWRHITVFRPFSHPPTGMPLSKPVFVLSDGELALIENPLKTPADIRRLLESPETVLTELGRRDYFFKTRYGKSHFDFLPSVRIGKMVFSEAVARWDPAAFDPDSEVLALTLKIFDAFHESVARHGATPVIVIFPERLDLRHYLQSGDKPHHTLIDHFESRGLGYVDLTEPLAKYVSGGALEDLLTPSGHYSGLANGLVARKLAAYLERQGLAIPSRARVKAAPETPDSR